MSSPGTTWRARLLLGLAIAGGVAALAAAPALDGPISRLANYESDGPDPIWDVPGIDSAALRRAGELLPDDARYFLFTPPAGQDAPYESTLRAGNVLAGAFLFLAPAAQVRLPADADWVLSYQAPTLVPPGLRAERTVALGEGVFLVRVRRAPAAADEGRE